MFCECHSNTVSPIWAIFISELGLCSQSSLCEHFTGYMKAEMYTSCLFGSMTQIILYCLDLSYCSDFINIRHGIQYMTGWPLV